MNCSGSLREELMVKFGSSYVEILASHKIGIAGAGGLGSNCAVNLVRSGFSDLVLVDHDKVEVSNLDRQFYFSFQVGLPKVNALKDNLLKIEPEIKIEPKVMKLAPENICEIFSDCGIIIEAVDKAATKAMIVENFIATGKLIVTASGLTGIGGADNIKTIKLREDLIVVGDLVSDVCRKPAVSPRVNVAAAKQADAVLEYVLKRSGWEGFK